MNEFITQLTEDIVETVERYKGLQQRFLIQDIKHLITMTLKEHDEEVRRETQTMFDADEHYDEGYDDGFIAGWQAAKEDIIDNLENMEIRR